jgi:hypothetical protein
MLSDFTGELPIDTECKAGDARLIEKTCEAGLLACICGDAVMCTVAHVADVTALAPSVSGD